MADIERIKTGRYDRATNKVIWNVTETGDILKEEKVVGTHENKITQIMDPDYVEENLKRLHAEKVQAETMMKQIKLELEVDVLTKHGVSEEEIKNYKKLLIAVPQYDKQEQQKSQLDYLEKLLKTTNDDIRTLTPIVERIKTRG